MTSLIAEALRLPPQERLKLIEEVWLSFADGHTELPISAADADEMDRRRQRYRSNPNSLIDWGQMKARLLPGGHAD